MRTTRILRLAGAVLATAMTLTACGAGDEPAATDVGAEEPTSGASAADGTSGEDQAEVGDESATRTVVDHVGREVEVPADPSAVIGLDVNYTADLVALGIMPIAGEDTIEGQFAGTEAYLPEGFDPASLPTFGSYFEPDLEVIIGLQPDLVIGPGTEFTEPFHENLSQIAPTLLTERGTNGDWQPRFRATAEAVGRTDEADAVEADFRAFVDALPAGLAETTVAFVRPTSEGGFRVDNLATSFPASVAEVAGIQVLEIEGVEVAQDASFYELSNERLGVLEDADVLIVPDFTVIGAEQDGLTQFTTNPLWEELPAVRDGAVVQVPGLVYNGGNYFAAKALLDALVQALA